MPGASPYPARRGRLLRRGGAAVLVSAIVLGAGGCAKFDATFGQREAVIQFKPATPDAARLQVRAACSHIPHVKPERLPTDHLLSDQLYNVRYQVGSASDAQLAKLQQCVSKFPSVLGISFTTPSGE